MTHLNKNYSKFTQNSNNYANNKKPKLNSSEFSNYRPISQLPLLTNILEKTVYTLTLLI